MIIIFVITFFISIAAGYFFTAALLPNSARAAFSYSLLKLCLSVGLGAGITSCSFFLWLITFNPDTGKLIMFDLLVLVVPVVFFLYITKLKNRSVLKIVYNDPSIKLSRILNIASTLFFIILGCSVAIFLIKSLKTPHGYLDAFISWNLRARFIFRGGDLWDNALSIYTDNPLLIPGAIARIWYYLDNDTTIVPMTVAFLFTFSTIGLLYSSVAVMRGRQQGLLASLLLVSSIIFIQSGMNQVAEVPLSFFYLATIALFHLNDKLRNEKDFILVLAGMSAGFAAWTKNEGNLFILSLFIAYTITIFPIKGVKKYYRDILKFCVGFAPILAIIFYFKSQVAPPSFYFDQGSTGLISKLMDPARYLLIINTWIHKLAAFGSGVLFLLPIYLALLGKSYKIKDDSITTFSIVVLCINLVGYFFIYIITPVDLSFQVSVTFHRLFLQLWPTIIFVFFMIVNPPIIIKECSNDENREKLLRV